MSNDIIKVNGVEYPSQRKACEENGVSRRTVQRRAEKLGKSFGEAIEILLKEKNESVQAVKEMKVSKPKEKPTKKKSPVKQQNSSGTIKVLNVEFTSQNQASRVVGVTRSTIQRRAVRNGTTFALELENHCKANNITTEILQKDLNELKGTQTTEQPTQNVVDNVNNAVNADKVQEENIYDSASYRAKTKFISNNPTEVKNFFSQLKKDVKTDYSNNPQFIFDCLSEVENYEYDLENVEKRKYLTASMYIPIKIVRTKQIATLNSILNLNDDYTIDMVWKMCLNTVDFSDILEPDYLDVIIEKYGTIIGYVANMLYNIYENDTTNSQEQTEKLILNPLNLEVRNTEEIVPFLSDLDSSEEVKFVHIQLCRLADLEPISFEALSALYLILNTRHPISSIYRVRTSSDEISNNIFQQVKIFSTYFKNVDFNHVISSVLDGFELFSHSYLIKTGVVKDGILFYNLAEDVLVQPEFANNYNLYVKNMDREDLPVVDVDSYTVQRLNGINQTSYAGLTMQYVRFENLNLPNSVDEIVINDKLKFRDLKTACDYFKISIDLVHKFKQLNNEQDSTKALKSVLTILKVKNENKNIFRAFQELTPHQKKLVAFLSKGFKILASNNQFKVVTADLKDSPQMNEMYSGNNSLKINTIMAILDSKFAVNKIETINKVEYKVIVASNHMNDVKNYMKALVELKKINTIQ